jgi:hypothetical protein
MNISSTVKEKKLTLILKNLRAVEIVEGIPANRGVISYSNEVC